MSRAHAQSLQGGLSQVQVTFTKAAHFLFERAADRYNLSIDLELLKWLVAQAYRKSAEAGQLASKFNMTPHDLRGIATSLKAATQVSMRELMAAGI